MKLREVLFFTLLTLLASCSSVIPENNESVYALEPEIVPIQKTIDLSPPNPGKVPYTDIAAETAGQLDRLFREQYEKSGSVYGMSASIITPEGSVWKSAAGYMDRGKTKPATSESMFYSGSTAKLVTSAIVFSLIEDGILSLDDTVVKWLPEYTALETVTIDDLLSNRSGIVNFILIRKYEEDKTRYWSEKELIDLALNAQGGLLFTPGTAHHYSNTGYVVLGLIAEKSAAETMSELFEERIVRACGLNRSFYMTENNSYAGMLDGFDKTGHYITDTHYNAEHPANPHAAGSYCMTPGEWARFLHSLLAGEIVSEKTLAMMLSNLALLGEDSTVETYYGRGIHLLRLNTVNGTENYIGHNGFLAGHSARLYFRIECGVTVCVASNQDTEIDPVLFSLSNFFLNNRQ